MPATVSFVLPARNTADTVNDAVERVLHADLGHPDLRREIIVVDDGSTDATDQLVRRIAARGLARVCVHPVPLGEGAALSSGLAMASGEIVVVADVTLAYDPSDACHLLAPIVAGSADAVYGSRYVATSREVPSLWDRLTDRIATVVSNGLTNVSLTDVTTKFISFRTDAVRGVVLRADGCGIAGELAALFATRKSRIFEVPVAYHARRRRRTTGRWMETFAQLTMMTRARFRSWQLEPLTPHQALPATQPAAARGARLTRLVLPIDLLPMTPTATRPLLRAN